MKAKLKEVKGRAAAADAPGQSLEQGAWLRQVVTGYFAYHAVPTNWRGAERVPTRGHPTLAADASAPQPKGWLQLGPDEEAR